MVGRLHTFVRGLSCSPRRVYYSGRLTGGGALILAIFQARGGGPPHRFVMLQSFMTYLPERARLRGTSQCACPRVWEGMPFDATADSATSRARTAIRVNLVFSTRLPINPQTMVESTTIHHVVGANRGAELTPIPEWAPWRSSRRPSPSCSRGGAVHDPAGATRAPLPAVPCRRVLSAAL